MDRSTARTAVIVSGGVAHDFPRTSAALGRVLADVGFAVTVSEDVEGSLLDLSSTAGPTRPLVVLNLLRWTMQVARYAHLRETWSISLSPTVRAALHDHVHDGGGLLGLHGASICFDDWPQWRDLLGGVWRWDTSAHPPLDGPVTVTVPPTGHPITAGIGSFTIVDEVYGFLDLAADVEPLMSARHTDTDHPLLWARTVGRGRVVYDALGHHPPSFDVPGHRTIVQRAALWAAGEPADGVTGVAVDRPGPAD